MKGSQMEEEEAREENKEEKIWSLRPIDFQVSHLLDDQFS